MSGRPLHVGDRRVEAAVVLAIVLHAAAAAAEQTRVWGVVRDAASGAGVPGATVVAQRVTGNLTSISSGTTVAEVTTAESGAFECSVSSGLSVVLRATARGYLPAQAGQLSPEQRGEPLSVGRDVDLVKRDIYMWRAASISGRVIVDGHPSPRIRVALWRRDELWRTGPRIVAETASSPEGDYSFGALPPGDYSVMVGEPKVPGRAGADIGIGFYPSARVWSHAAVVALSAGQNVEQRDIALNRERTGSVVGQFVGLDGPVRSAVVRVVRVDTGSSDEITSWPESGIASTDAEGRFMFQGIGIGSYVVFAETRDGGVEVRATPPSPMRRDGRDGIGGGVAIIRKDEEAVPPVQWGRAVVELGEGRTPLRLSANEGPRVAVNADVGDKGSEPRDDVMVVLQRRQAGEPGDRVTIRAGTVRAIQPGEYIAFVASRYPLKFGPAGPDNRTGVSHIVSGLHEWTLARQQRGQLRVESGRRLENAVVFVFPVEGRGSRPDECYRALKGGGEATTWTIRDLPVGDYMVAVINEPRFQRDWQDATSLDELAGRATRATVHPDRTNVLYVR